MAAKKAQKSFFDKNRKTTNRTNDTRKTPIGRAKASAVIQQDIKPAKIKKPAATKAMQHAQKKVAEGAAKQRFESALLKLNWQPYLNDGLTKHNRTPEQQVSFEIVEYWSNIPQYTLDEAYFPRESTRKRGKIVGQAIESSDNWPIEILKAMLRWAKKTADKTEAGETPLMGRACMDLIIAAIDARRETQDIAADAVEYGLMLEDVVMAFQEWCRKNGVKLTAKS